MRLIRCYLQYIHASQTPPSAFRLRRLAEAAGASNDCALVVVPCAFSYMVVTFRGRRKANLVFWWSKVEFFVTGARDRSGFASKCRFRGRCNTLAMVVIVEVTGVVNRSFWTCGSISWQAQHFVNIDVQISLHHSTL